MSVDIDKPTDSQRPLPLETIFLLKELDRWAALYSDVADLGWGSAKAKVCSPGIALANKHIIALVGELQKTGAIAQLAKHLDDLWGVR